MAHLTFHQDLSGGFTFSFYVNQDYLSDWGVMIGNWSQPGNFWFGSQSPSGTTSRFHYNIAGKTGNIGFSPSMISNDILHHFLNSEHIKNFIDGTES